MEEPSLTHLELQVQVCSLLPCRPVLRALHRQGEHAAALIAAAQTKQAAENGKPTLLLGTGDSTPLPAADNRGTDISCCNSCSTINSQLLQQLLFLHTGMVPSSHVQRDIHAAARIQQRKHQSPPVLRGIASAALLLLQGRPARA